MSELQDLASLVRSNTPLVVIETPEESRVVDLFRHVLTHVWRALFRWSITEGMRRVDLDREDPAEVPPDLSTTLQAIKAHDQRGIYLLLDAMPYLGYATTEMGIQSETTDASISLASGATTCRNLYVAMTRGRQANNVCVITDTHDITEARDLLERVIATDRADTPATTQRRELGHADFPDPVPRVDAQNQWIIDGLSDLSGVKGADYGLGIDF